LQPSASYANSADFGFDHRIIDGADAGSFWPK